MLQRPEIGTKEHILLWLASKPADECYEWMSADCPSGQYLDKYGQYSRELNDFARVWPQNFGALHARARSGVWD